MGVEAPVLCKGAKSAPCVPYIVGVEAPIAVCCGCGGTHCRTLWVWRHPLPYVVGVEAPIAVRCGCGGTHCRTLWVWRHPCLLKGWVGTFSLHAGTQSSHFVTVLHWHCTLFLLSGIGFDNNCKSSAEVIWFHLFFVLFL